MVSENPEKDFAFHNEQGDGAELRDVALVLLLCYPDTFCMSSLLGYLPPLTY